MKAVILSIGDELILGQSVDTNSAWLSARLADLGIMALYHQTVADDLDAIVAALKESCERAELIIATGGLGPTADDLTRQALGVLLQRPLDLHPPSLERIRAFFKTLGREMPVSNRIQAMVPRGVEILDNDWGTAPGMKAKVGRSVLFFFPGVPHEMSNMATRYVFPLFQRGSGTALAVEAITTFGAGESLVAEKLGDLMKRDRNPVVGTTVSGGMVTVRIRSEAPTPALARKSLADTVMAVEQRLGTLVIGQGGVMLPAKVGQLCKEKGKRIATVESCTAGLVASLLTELPGASDYYVGGWVTYSNAMKVREVGVQPDVLEAEGAVSEGVARAMVEGALRESEADLAVSLTGIAGPDGGTPEKPVGTVWIAVGRREGAVILVTKAERFQFPGTRAMIRDRAAKTALNLLRLELL